MEVDQEHLRISFHLSRICEKVAIMWMMTGYRRNLCEDEGNSIIYTDAMNASGTDCAWNINCVGSRNNNNNSGSCIICMISTWVSSNKLPPYMQSLE